MKDFYNESRLYETFIRRAYKCQRQDRYGADVHFMQNLWRTEVNGKPPHGLKKYNVQLEKIKSHIEKALDKFLNFKLTDIEKPVLFQLKSDLDSSDSTSSLMAINKALESAYFFGSFQSFECCLSEG